MGFTQRTADYIIIRAYAHAFKKASAPATTENKYIVALSILDSVQKDWADEPGIEWDSLYQTVSNGTVTATDTFDLDDSINYISKREGDYITLVSPDKTQTVTYTLVRPDQLYAQRYNQCVAQVGRTLKFSKAFNPTDSTIGYTIKVPAMVYVDDIDSGSDLVQVDDPMYAVYMLGAELIRDDVVKKDQYDNLLNLGANKMEKMRANNGGQLDTVATPWQPEGASRL